MKLFPRQAGGFRWPPPARLNPERYSAFIDRWILDVGLVRGTSGAAWGFGSLLRLLQVGNLQAYSFLFGLGIVGLIYFTLFR